MIIENTSLNGNKIPWSFIGRGTLFAKLRRRENVMITTRGIPDQHTKLPSMARVRSGAQQSTFVRLNTSRSHISVFSQAGRRSLSSQLDG
jgi:hypothetical protein